MPKPRRNNISDTQILVEYARTRSAPKVALTFGLGVTTVTRALDRHGVVRTGLVEYRASRRKRTVDDPPYIGEYIGSTEDILNMYRAGLSMRAIAAKIGRSTRVVSRRVQQAGESRPYQGAGPDHSMWTGGRVQVGTYWRVWLSPDDPLVKMRTKGGYVLEHRLVMARKLGRILTRTETVHHIDGDPGNNDLANLQLRQGRHGKHIVMCCGDCGSRNVIHAPLG